MSNILKLTDKFIKLGISQFRRKKRRPIIKRKKRRAKVRFAKIDTTDFRDNESLKNIVSKYEKELEISEDVKIKITWGRAAKRILGSVRLKNGISVIKISKYLGDPKVPEFVLEEVILHELIHIKTGHGSVTEKKYKHAHRGGIIKKEMAQVGHEDLYLKSNAWLKENWFSYLKQKNTKHGTV
jgi:predicted metal-dependent hydrolase